MAKLILASVLCIFLLVKGIDCGEVGAGTACPTGTTCVSTATCEDEMCNANVGETCANAIPCVGGAACDPADSKCKTKVDEGDTCTPDSANKICNPDATATLTCDTTCKVIHGQTCTSSTACIAEATCTGEPLQCTCTGEFTASSDSTECVPKATAGESCATKPCVSTATCDESDSKCKANAGQVCDANTPCVSTATCDGTCKVNLGESCAGSPTCVTGASCTSDSVCKKEVTKAGEACPTLTTFCTSTTLTCDGGLCKVPAGQSCAATLATQCTAHADCPTTGDNPNICTCSTTDGFRSNAGVCEGTKDKDASCANDNCKPGLVCDGGKCKVAITEAGEDCSASVTDKACDTTTLACQNDKCKLKIEQVCTDTDQCVTGAKCEGSLTTKQCNCPMGVQPSSDKAQCGGAMGIAASMLLVVVTFVTSRFL